MINSHSNRPPDTLLILGTDASGKNHIANLIVRILEKSGYGIEKREGWFSEKASDAVSSEDKGFIDLLIEKMVLITFPLTQYMMPFLLTLLIKRDLNRFGKTGKTDKKVIVISHSALRVLAFYLGHKFYNEETIKIPHYLRIALRAIKPATQANTIVLDIAPEIRHHRIAHREKHGKMDNFDHYMAQDTIRSERIESFLVWLAKTYLDAVIIENNDLNDAELINLIEAAFYRFQNN